MVTAQLGVPVDCRFPEGALDDDVRLSLPGKPVPYSALDREYPKAVTRRIIQWAKANLPPSTEVHHAVEAALPALFPNECQRTPPAKQTPKAAIKEGTGDPASKAAAIPLRELHDRYGEWQKQLNASQPLRIIDLQDWKAVVAQMKQVMNPQDVQRFERAIKNELAYCQAILDDCEFCAGVMLTPKCRPKVK